MVYLFASKKKRTKKIILELTRDDEIWNENNSVIASGWLSCFTFFFLFFFICMYISVPFFFLSFFLLLSSFHFSPYLHIIFFFPSRSFFLFVFIPFCLSVFLNVLLHFSSFFLLFAVCLSSFSATVQSLHQIQVIFCVFNTFLHIHKYISTRSVSCIQHLYNDFRKLHSPIFLSEAWNGGGRKKTWTEETRRVMRNRPGYCYSLYSFNLHDLEWAGRGINMTNSCAVSSVSFTEACSYFNCPKRFGQTSDFQHQPQLQPC